MAARLRAALLAALLGAQIQAASVLPVRLRVAGLKPGTVAVAEIPARQLPPKLVLTGLSQEAGFYLYGSATALALLAVPLDTRPGPLTLRLVWEGGLSSQALPCQVLKAGYPRQRLKVPRLKAKLRLARGDAEHELFEEASARSEGPPLWHGAFLAPVNGAVTAPFGVSRSYNRGQASWRHKGLDLRAPKGTPVLAANDGVVALAHAGLALSGGTVVLAHGYGLTSAYYHLSRVDLAEGDSVARGQVLGLSGDTGLATGPHLHFQMELRSFPVHPGQWMETSPLASPSPSH